MQHCPTCGAENDDEAQFCAECGAPLAVEADPISVDDEPTILSTNISELIEAQKTEIFDGSEDHEETIQVSQAEIFGTTPAQAETTADPEIPTGETVGSAGASPPSPPAGGDSNGGSSNGGMMSQRNIIIAVVALLLLCCCLFALVGGALLAFSEEFALRVDYDVIPWLQTLV